MKLISPVNKQPFQRNIQDKATILVEGLIEKGNKQVTLSAIPLKGGISKTLTTTVENANFSIPFTLTKGYYTLSVSNDSESVSVIVAIGDIFGIKGHSFTEGLGTKFCKDERVIIPASRFEDMTDTTLYQKTGFISMTEFSASTATDYTSVEDHINFAINRGIWGRLGDLLVAQNDCPVAFYNAGFGGSTLEQWTKSARFESFEHSFVNSSKRMPIIKLLNTLKFLVPRTGIRGILSIHGDNDKFITNDPEVIANEYKTIIETARNESNLPNLHFVLASSVTDYQEHLGIIDGTIKAVVEGTNISIGPDIYLYDNSLRLEDKLHLNEKGEQKAAEDFAKVLGSTYLTKAQPFTINNSLNEPTNLVVSSSSTVDEKPITTTQKDSDEATKILLGILAFVLTFTFLKLLIAKIQRSS
ncbi:sialate O-acetylesterase [Flectobacillus roseus]|uniref:sialate O-acetylesterase n=1 Tax=Flectobacillus roseus TaxID=502259 RepID=UPI0024B76E12|nr:sialate O-acetylesterase [Flectobacillus roseus]MDI9872189.1 sialate O-acetylesterase [Flectobacillus roseus]